MSTQQEENLDLLDLGDESEVDTLPEATPFSAPRPKRPWLLMGIGVAIIVLATWIIVAHVGGGNGGSSVNIDLDAPVVEAEVPSAQANLNVPDKPVSVVSKTNAEKNAKSEKQKVAEQKPIETDGNPIRVVEDRKEVTFNPDKAETKPVATTTKKITAQAKPAVKKPVATTNGNIYVQFGSYSTRELAQAAEQKIRKSHQSLFAGKQFVILAAEVNGKTI